MTEKRYSVWSNERDARETGGQFSTWEEANNERHELIAEAPTRWHVWLHNDDGTVTDVTDGEPEPAKQWWFCVWSKLQGYSVYDESARVVPNAPEPVVVCWRDREAVGANGHIRSTTKPSVEQFQAHVLAETGVEVPCVEEPQWWWWDVWTKEWREGNGDYPYCNRDSVRVWATESTRDEKRDALLAAARAAGKDGEG